ncbi:carbohydrate ABC transporter permease [Phycicoccus endophyticus]|uniref:Carbohydrate ABC transporter permease n=1 Tax=Phycicoccus endophyticus TaxID=1690220 RepID=A0A7G9R1J6_9MICO|nr:carbohydrate ABC transporter permease [Phycicoccus endophyticus]NHI18739.1 carbohydrate ABC transporter permease [Phycicoccus endophyticus]QNN49471.1 carbohydrate ABC transporter permease [Phycicoccus endophyticus]GGL36883.1 sugar ABC transporter permease [Phycicoccus endophyticus]
MNRSLRGSLVTLVTWVLVLVFFFPVFWMVLNGFKPESVASSVNPRVFFTPVTEGYQLAMDRGMQGYLLNSVTASVTATIIAVVLAIPAAYALSIRRVKNVEGALTFFISTRFMPLAAVVLPLFMILKELNLLDNVYMLAIVYGAVNLPVTVWMMRSFFLEVPFEIIEAARVDGAGLGREIFRVALPLVLPGVAAAALICFIFSWNEYFLATLLTSSAARTTPPFLGSFVDGRGQFLAVLSAAATIAALPVIIAGWVAQKQLVRGLSMGAIK